MHIECNCHVSLSKTNMNITTRMGEVITTSLRNYYMVTFIMMQVTSYVIM